MMTNDALVSLAPCYLPSRRIIPSDGHEFESALSQFGAADQAILRRVYEVVSDAAFLGSRSGDCLERHLVREIDEDFLNDVHRLGGSGLKLTSLRKVVHDIRGGGLSVLVGLAYFLWESPGNQDYLQRCADAADDHARIMRSLLPDIDPAARDRDREGGERGIGRLLDKWDGARVRGPHGTVTVSVRNACGATATFPPCECAAVGRVLYNHINNAMRFASDDRVELCVFPVRNGLVRWVVINHLDPSQASFLESQQDTKRLYAGGITTGGEGIGLASCAEIVANCFGLDSPAQAVEELYLGSMVSDAEYYAWFHWPSQTPDGCGLITGY
ncbi:hypothetical protein [Zavarzinella formosa]|uniref:hypothetical protein n=1 Tax=Zavarzinella formosa TaxID=360055 RepID=UPI0002E90899|nr:hypothetical protein [Zavarzinella formosa]